MDDFDPSSLLELALEENDGALNSPTIHFEDPGTEVKQIDAGCEQSRTINIDPEFSNTDQIDKEEANKHVDPNTSVPGCGNKVITSDQNVAPVTEENFGFDDMCSMPVSMFQLFNLGDDQIAEAVEHQQQTEQVKQPVESAVEKVPNKPTTASKKRSVSYTEKTFRKNLFKNDPDTIRIFKLHCSVCTNHIGCSLSNIESLSRVHKYLNVLLCRQCHDFYGTGNFPIEEGSEIYCGWCGQGGTMFCCSNCPKVFCESCIILNFGRDRRNQIEATSTWSCFACNPTELWPHRAICWGVQRLMRETRMKMPQMNKEQRNKSLNVDTSDCCSTSAVVLPVTLPPLAQLQKVPMCLFADKHSKSIITALQQNQQPTIRRNQSVFIRKGGPHHQRTPTPNEQIQTSQVRVQSKPLPYKADQVPQTVRNNLWKLGNNSFVNRRAKNSNSTPVAIINLVEDSDTAHSNLDLSWLQRSVKESSHCLFNCQSLLNQFDLLSGKLRTDVEQVDLFTNKLHALFKITISNLAKIDYNMLQGLKDCMTPKQEIKIHHLSNITLTKKSLTQLPPSVVSKVPVAPAVPDPTPVPSATQEPTEEEDLSCLLFCETVMTEAGDGNKENEFNTNNNLVQKDTRLATPRPATNQVNNSRKRGPQAKSQSPASFPTIVLDDEDTPPTKLTRLSKEEYDDLYKKFNLKRCMVLLSRCDDVF